jgi:hypothetical protein
MTTTTQHEPGKRTITSIIPSQHGGHDHTLTVVRIRPSNERKQGFLLVKCSCEAKKMPWEKQKSMQTVLPAVASFENFEHYAASFGAQVKAFDRRIHGGS